MKLVSCRDFCRRFGVGLRAGADLLMLLASEGRHGSPRQRKAMAGLREGAMVGAPLAETMAAQGKFFPPLMVSMTRVGEMTGRLERTMLALADHYEQQVALRRDFKRVIAWPVIQLVMAIGVISLLIWIMGILTPAGGGQMIDLLGLGLRGNRGVLIFWAYIACFAAVLAGIVMAFRKNVGGVQNIIPLLYRIPVAGSALQTITLSRFSWTLALSLDAGLDPIASIRLALDATDSEYYRSAQKDSENSIRGGQTLAGGLAAMHIFPDEFISQVEIAELSGTDAESIDRIAKDYDERARAAMKTIAGILTGVIWISVAGLILFFFIRILMVVLGMYSEALQPINLR